MDPGGAKRGTVLVVDDELPLLRSYVRVLAAEGYEVHEAQDGGSAQALLDRYEFDAVVSDVNMPGMSGLDLVRAVRARDLDLPVILVTGTPSDESATQAVDYGAMLYLVKPIANRMLTHVVEHAVRIRRIARLKRLAAQHVGARDFPIGDRAGLELAFDRAMSSLWVAFQPLVRWGNKTLFGYEGLVRNEDPILAYPPTLVDAAIKLGRLHDLGRAVRRAVAANAVDAPETASLFVNLHPADLEDDELYSPDAPLTKLAPRVVLEITERASIQGIDDLQPRIARLRRAGFRIAIDDLGAGYSGLNSFAELKPEVAKFDMALVRDVDKDDVRRTLVQALVRACHEMDVLVIAEGVENIAERDVLHGLGCDILQGFLFGRPGKSFPPPSW